TSTSDAELLIEGVGSSALFKRDLTIAQNELSDGLVEVRDGALLKVDRNMTVSRLGGGTLRVSGAIAVPGSESVRSEARVEGMLKVVEDGRIEVVSGASVSVSGAVELGATLSGNALLQVSGERNGLHSSFLANEIIVGPLSTSDAEVQLSDGGLMAPENADTAATLTIGAEGVVRVQSGASIGEKIALNGSTRANRFGTVIGGFTPPGLLDNATLEVSSGGEAYLEATVVGRSYSDEFTQGTVAFFTVSGASSVAEVRNVLTIEDTGKVSITQGGSMFLGDDEVVDGFRARNQYPNQLMLVTGGLLFGTGVLEVQQIPVLQGASGVNAFQGSRIRPGNSPGRLTIDGNLMMHEGSELEIEIAGLTPGDQHDVLVVSGDLVQIEGSIVLQFLSGFAPRQGDVFEFLLTEPGAEVLIDQAAFEVHGLLPGFEFEITHAGGAYRVLALNNGVAAAPEPQTLLMILSGLLFIPCRSTVRRQD
ncbi:MAG: hypothetical protein KDA37_04705, partial [Planctomycetales bacterium]|nr:hypothetical protein [Planctomycetales bacterium]